MPDYILPTMGYIGPGNVRQTRVEVEITLGGRRRCYTPRLSVFGDVWAPFWPKNCNRWNTTHGYLFLRKGRGPRRQTWRAIVRRGPLRHLWL